ncbi:hypothetical protein F4561_005211 [Lipingzhangella halophila]|uniref:Uncharacterized protein n=1 Tax=Lipingzhangella halophila TaxID=1783352 RepID=A0A7W7RMW7_9ACTN|nr:hypothetical protein [Lipingzhangella halophila]MBB4934391.1 hypothetical protein [Lipingzhangella halophila]
MNTSMPDAHPKVVERQVQALREAGPGSLLVWHEPTDRVSVVAAGTVPDSETMIIAGHRAVAQLNSFTETTTRTFDQQTRDAQLAATLSRTARDTRREWPEIKAMTPSIVEPRRELAAQGLTVAEPPAVSERSRRTLITDEYASSDTSSRLRLTLTVARAHEAPAEIAVVSTPHRQPVWALSVDVDAHHPRPSATVIAAAARAALTTMSEAIAAP